MNQAVRIVDHVCRAIVVAIAVLVVTGLTLRNVVGLSVAPIEEYAGYLFVCLTFLSLGVSLSANRVFFVDVLSRRLRARFQLLLSNIWDVISLGFVLTIGWFVSRHVFSTYTRGVVSSTETSTPLYLPQLAIPLGLLLVGLILIRRIVLRSARLADELNTTQNKDL